MSIQKWLRRSQWRESIAWSRFTVKQLMENIVKISSSNFVFNSLCNKFTRILILFRYCGWRFFINLLSIVVGRPLLIWFDCFFSHCECLFSQLWSNKLNSKAHLWCFTMNINYWNEICFRIKNLITTCNLHMLWRLIAVQKDNYG